MSFSTYIAIVRLPDGSDWMVQVGERPRVFWTGRKRGPVVMSQEGRESMRRSARRGFSLSPEHRAKLSVSMKGKGTGPLSAKRRGSMSDAQLKRYAERPMSDAHKESIRRGLLERNAKMKQRDDTGREEGS